MFVTKKDVKTEKCFGSMQIKLVSFTQQRHMEMRWRD